MTDYRIVCKLVGAGDSIEGVLKGLEIFFAGSEAFARRTTKMHIFEIEKWSDQPVHLNVRRGPVLGGDAM